MADFANFSDVGPGWHRRQQLPFVQATGDWREVVIFDGLRR